MSQSFTARAGAQERDRVLFRSNDETAWEVAEQDDGGDGFPTNITIDSLHSLEEGE